MPGFDGTGPRGSGPGSGGGFGYCAGERPPYAGWRRGGYYGRGAGWGAGRGPGRGVCRWWAGGPVPYYGPQWAAPADEKAFLNDQAEQLRAELADLERRMADLEQGSE